MKVAILAGGVGSRIQEETEIKPKPMVEIGGRPILWHIMKLYAHAGYKDFVIALGYKGDYVKRWLIEYSSLQGDLTVSLRDGKVEVLEGEREDWTVSLVDTGVTTGGSSGSPRTWAARPSCSPGGTASPTSTSRGCSSSTARTGSTRR